GVVREVMNNLRKHAIIDYEVLKDPVSEVEREVKVSTETYVIYYDEEPGALWGVKQVTFMDDVAAIWSVTTPVVDQHRVAFGRETKRLLKVLLARYRVLCGVVDVNYDCSIRWLRWLGFEVTAPKDFGGGLILCRFEMRR